MSKNQQLLLMALGGILVLVIVVLVYKLFFEFDNTTVQAEVNTAAAGYAQPAAAAIVINDAIKHILLSVYLTQQVLDYATISGLPKEQVLVNAAVAQAVAMKYI